MCRSDKIATATLVKALLGEANAFYNFYFVANTIDKSGMLHRQNHFNNIINLVNILQARKSETFLDELFKEVKQSLK